MSRFIKFLAILGACIVSLLIFVNVVEKNNEVFSLETKYSRLATSRSEKLNDKRLLNLVNFDYAIEPSHCNATLLVWIVTSYAGDAAPRSALRRAYATAELAVLGIRRIFMLGLLDEASARRTRVIEAAIVHEAMRYDDILQGNFYEAYRNLTYKHLMGLKWASESCAHARYIVKQDDDVIVDLYEIVARLRLATVAPPRPRGSPLLAGYVLRHMRPVREPANKWFVTRDEYATDEYPEFLSGWFYIIDRESARKIVRHSYTCEKYFWIDDVFVTGILREELKVSLTDTRQLYTTDYRFLRCCIEPISRRKKLKCDFAIGPNGGRVELQVDFQRYAAFCRDVGCTPRRPELLVAKTCVAEYETGKVKTMGSARIDPVFV